MISKPPGIEDIFPDKITKWNHIIDSARYVFDLYNYKEVIIPIMEFTEVFARGLGDETDIVSKEMFTFEDRGGRSLTLRPEGTASVVRAYNENGEYNRLASCKLFYTGPMFRAEKPQRGRLRQFNQFGAEFFGSDNPYFDYEIISMLYMITNEIGIEDFTILINSIGCETCRADYIEELKKYYSSLKEDLCKDCQRRLEKNTLRLLDCKVESCNALKADAPRITDHLDEQCGNHYATVKSHLNNASIPYNEDPLLVRGLDYYTRTTFEFVTDNLGSQNAFAAGGRYDNLVKQFGGKDTPAVGFAAGIERLYLLIEEQTIDEPHLDIYMIHSGDETLELAIKVADNLRENGFTVDIDPTSKGFKSQFKKADRENAELAFVIGEDEYNNNSVTIKSLQAGTQKTVSQNEILDYLAQNI